MLLLASANKLFVFFIQVATVPVHVCYCNRHECNVIVGIVLFVQDTISVHRPSFYAQRFLNFMATRVFKKVTTGTHQLATLLGLCVFPVCQQAIAKLLFLSPPPPHPKKKKTPTKFRGRILEMPASICPSHFLST